MKTDQWYVILDIIKKDSSFTFILVGDINHEYELEHKKKILDILYAAEDYKEVFFDMAEVDLIDSCGIGMLIYVNNFLKNKEKTLYLTNVTEKVMKLFEYGFLDKLFTIKKS